MGIHYFDQYSLLHFSVGSILYFWGFTLKMTLILHIIFEIIENTNFGMNIINNYITYWPGGKYNSDSYINSISDISFTLFGWYISYNLDILYK